MADDVGNEIRELKERIKIFQTIKEDVLCRAKTSLASLFPTSKPILPCHRAYEHFTKGDVIVLYVTDKNLRKGKFLRGVVTQDLKETDRHISLDLSCDIGSGYKPIRIKKKIIGNHRPEIMMEDEFGCLIKNSDFANWYAVLTYQYKIKAFDPIQFLIDLDKIRAERRRSNMLTHALRLMHPDIKGL